MNERERISQFSTLMQQLMSEKSPQVKQKIAEELTAATMADHGFVYFFEFLRENLHNDIKALDVFSRITLTRPSKFPTLLEYLTSSRANFVEFITVISSDTALFDTFIGKLFYSMRAHNIESEFDFFYQPTDEQEINWLCTTFKKLLEAQFYLEDLKLVYMRNLQTVLDLYDESSAMKACLMCGIKSINPPLNFWIKAADKKKPKLIAIFGQTNNNQSLLEALVLSSLFDDKISPTIMAGINDSLQPSDEFIDRVNEALLHSKRLINQELAACLALKPFGSRIKRQSSPSQPSWVDAIIEDCKSSEPAIIAHGLYNLRKNFREHKSEMSKQMNVIAALCADKLFDDDTYIYVNADKACAEVGSLDCGVFGTYILSKFKSLQDSSKFPRIVEVFNAWINESILILPKHESLLLDFFQLSLNTCNDANEDARISSINALNICAYFDKFFAKHSIAIFTFINLSDRQPKIDDLETQATFALIDTFLSLSSSIERFQIDHQILSAVDTFCRKALILSNQQLSSMAVANLLKLEQMRRF